MRTRDDKLFLDPKELQTIIHGLESIQKEDLNALQQADDSDERALGDSAERYNNLVLMRRKLAAYEDSKGIFMEENLIGILQRAAERANAPELALRLIREYEYAEARWENRPRGRFPSGSGDRAA